MVTATEKASDPRSVVRAFKRAERANREAAKAFARFIARLESLGIKFEVVETERGQSRVGKDRSEEGNGNSA